MRSSGESGPSAKSLADAARRPLPGADRGGEALVGELVHPGGSLGVLNGKADNVPVSVQVEVDIRHEVVEKRLRERYLK